MLERAKRLINEYCLEEFGSENDFANLEAVGVGYTTVTDEEIPIQAYVDLIHFRIEKRLCDVLVETRQYESLEALIDGELYDLQFDDLAYASEEQIELFHKLDN